MDKKDLRKHNLQKVRQALRALKQATKPQLAERTGLSAMTVNTLVKLLQRESELVSQYYEANADLSVTYGGQEYDARGFLDAAYDGVIDLEPADAVDYYYNMAI